jgi:hypothetical protein
MSGIELKPNCPNDIKKRTWRRGMGRNIQLLTNWGFWLAHLSCQGKSSYLQKQRRDVMKRVIGCAYLALLVLGLIQILSPKLEAQNRNRNRNNPPRDGVCFYMDADYRGAMFCTGNGESQRNVGERYNDRMSSIRIFGRAEVTVYDDENFGGSRQTFSQDVPNLGDWNDRVTSFQVAGGRQYGRQYEEQVSGNEPRNGACFYMDEDNRGDSFCMNSGESKQNLGNRFNDKISSVRVFGRARVVVYENENFGGASKAFARDVSNMGNFNDKISAIEVR